MATMTDKERALKTYRDDYNCAQSILSVYGERFGLDKETSMTISCGFGAGMGRQAGLCGAISGAYMVLGLRYGMVDSVNQEEKQLTYAKVRDFTDKFFVRNGASSCRDLLGCDISTAKGFHEARDRDLMTKVCEKVVVDAAEILEELLSV
jgi:C_GCAxxG_C_C family probable redox protein